MISINFPVKSENFQRYIKKVNSVRKLLIESHNPVAEREAGEERDYVIPLLQQNASIDVKTLPRNNIAHIRL